MVHEKGKSAQGWEEKKERMTDCFVSNLPYNLVPEVFESRNTAHRLLRTNEKKEK